MLYRPRLRSPPQGEEGDLHGGTKQVGGEVSGRIDHPGCVRICADERPIVLGRVGTPAASRIVAAGGAGTWLVVGLIAYALVGVIGIAVSALFYQYLEGTLGRPYTGWRNAAAWVHLILGGVGGSAAALLMAWGGYAGGAALIPAQLGGGGQNAAWVHENVLGPLVVPIAGLIAITLLGFFIGGIGYVTAWWSARRT